MPDGSTVTRDADGRTWWEDRFGKLHREGGPAIEEPDGTGSWYWHGKLHRDDGPAHDTSAAQHWYRYDVRHRDDGPAIIGSDGSKAWLVNGEYHRVDGPAIEKSRVVNKKNPGSRTYDDEYYIHGRRFTEEEFYRYVDQDTGEVLVPPGRKLTHDKK